MESRKRKRLLLAFAGLVAVGAGLWLLLRNPEPSYQGKRLSEWLAIYLAAETLTGVKEAGVAIQTIGTNALPFLVEWIDYNPGPWRRMLGPHVEKLPGWLERSALIQRTIDSGAYRAMGSQRAFGILGPMAAPAISELHRLAIHSYRPDTRRGAAIALCAIGPSAMTAWTNILATASFDERRLIMKSLEKLSTNAAPAVPMLVRHLQHGDLQTATASAQTLATLRLDLDLVIPALTDRLADPNSRMRAAAANALGTFGAQAFIALPALNQLKTDPDQEVSRAARAAITAVTGVPIERLSPEVLQKPVPRP